MDTVLDLIDLARRTVSEPDVASWLSLAFVVITAAILTRKGVRWTARGIAYVGGHRQAEVEAAEAEPLSKLTEDLLELLQVAGAPAVVQPKEDGEHLLSFGDSAIFDFGECTIITASESVENLLHPDELSLVWKAARQCKERVLEREREAARQRARRSIAGLLSPGQVHDRDPQTDKNIYGRNSLPSSGDGMGYDPAKEACDQQEAVQPGSWVRKR